jgi:superfamily II DNA or RNA helicase
MTAIKQPSPSRGPKLNELIGDSRNSITADNVAAISRRDYEKSLDHLASYVFWRPTSRPIRPLWPHQVSALELAGAYLAADRRLPSEGNVPEAALIKMPTGTGKSGVIAVLVRCLPMVRRVLILTPRTALADQLRKDVSYRFWQHLNFSASDDETFVAGAANAGAALEANEIGQFLPSKAKHLLAQFDRADRVVAIGTFQALELTRRTALEKDTNQGDPSFERRLLDAIDKFDLVIVDEGHYEPAPTWSRAVRDFNLPTILLSATPYRNDYKSFRVRGRFVFNYSFGDAQSDKTIRAVRFSCREQSRATKRTKGAKRFVDLLTKEWPSIHSEAVAYTDHPKLIVRADDFKKLTLLQNLIEGAFGLPAILIHDQIRGSEPKKRRFHSVDLARGLPDWEKVNFWLHQSKLLEGIDDSSFVAVAIYDRFENARQLVQQVGRALRTTDKTRRTVQNAWVISVPEQHALLFSSWNRYLEFELYASENPQRLVQAEGALPDRLLEMMPKVQYLAGEFRPCFVAGAVQDAAEFRVPASASVFEVSPSFDLAAAATEVKEALLAKDRFKPLPIEGMPHEALAFVYYEWRSSPYLSLQFFPEWTLGICVLVREGNFLLVNDTAGIVLDPSDLGIRRADRSAVARLMPESTSKQAVRVSRMATFSLDVSERAIRSMAIRTRSLADTFGDLLEPVLVPTTTFGFVGRRGRYLGLTRGRISDSYGEPMPLQEFCQWAKNRAIELANAASVRNRVFDRYARVRDRLDNDQAAPKSILLDFDDTFAEFAPSDQDQAPSSLTDAEYDDLCSDVDGEGNFEITLATKKFPCKVTFHESSQRYLVESEALDKEMSGKPIGTSETELPVTAQINREQSFRIIVAEPGVVYAHRRFFEANTSHVRPDNSVPLLDRVYRVSALDNMVSEKGEKLFRKRAEWTKKSVFGLMKAICDASLASEVAGSERLFKDLRAFDIIVCDDDGEEIADFLAIDHKKKRVVLIHAKVGKSKSGMSVRALQEVGRQVLASLAFCSAVSREAKITPGRWGAKVNANGVILNLNRVFRNSEGLRVSDIESAAADALADRSWNREIWIVGGNLMRREKVETAIRGNSNNRVQQFLMFLESLVTGCARGNSTLRIYCN